MNFEDLFYKGKKIKEPYITSEIGSNFDQNLSKAYKLIEVAAQSGANAVKFQLFKTENLYRRGHKLYNIFKSIELNPKWIPNLIDCSKKNSVDFFASPFDKVSADVLLKNKVNIFKIASSEITNLNLIKYLAKKRKYLIISTGMSDLIDIDNAVAICQKNNNIDKLLLLHCFSIYPLPIRQSNLNVIETLKKKYKLPIGFSDHTKDEIAALVSVGMKSIFFEKHITLDKKLNGPDHFYALEPKEFKIYCKSIKRAYLALGSSKKVLLKKEKEEGRREGIFSSKELFMGTTLKRSDIIFSRPALGIRARDIDKYIGKKLKNDIIKNSPIYESDLL